MNGLHDITLNDVELDEVRRGMVESVHNGLERTLELADRLRQQGDLDEGATAADLRGSFRILLREWAALDALGWHDDHAMREGASS